ncbi:hypothetical protein E2F46_01875 [Luteimonas aestuarii]|uniref:Uncharacterized protein n=1 Tax=Luteimonas aestuarii TaxID=453837 RepID=A0A4R5U4F6_9GAMM|nr:hypothetical protein [Luteimonas aestuarii]TDK28640.1 hypothetical protein E2F46_01875 [Luteimonas aestuarii]
MSDPMRRRSVRAHKAALLAGGIVACLLVIVGGSCGKADLGVVEMVVAGFGDRRASADTLLSCGGTTESVGACTGDVPGAATATNAERARASEP